MTSLDLSIVVPLFNEAENLRQLHAEICAALAEDERTFELIFVDDGSTDPSLEVLRRLASEDQRVRILRLERNLGQTAAFGAGLRAARAPVLITLDADLQNDPADIPAMLEMLESCDVVCGVRVRRCDSFVRRLSAGVANAVRNRLTHESITDVGCSLKVLRSEYARNLPLFDGLHRFLPTLLRMQGARIREVPVNHRPRLHGQSKYGIRNRLWTALVDLFAVRWMLRRWIDRGAVSEIKDGCGSIQRAGSRHSSIDISSASARPRAAMPTGDSAVEDGWRVEGRPHAADRLAR